MNNKFLYLIFLLLFPSCVEHIFLIKIEPNGNFNINYSANGDLKDLQNDDFALPNSVDWKIEHQIQKKNDNYFFSSHKDFNLNDKIPDSFNINDSIPYSSLLKHPINLNYLYNFDIHETTMKITDHSVVLYDTLHDGLN